MTAPNETQVVKTLLDRHRQTYARQAGFTVKDTPSPLYRLLCLATLLSARISADIAVAATRALAEKGWTTPEKLANATWADRTAALNKAGYARYDESTSRMLGDSADLLLDRWSGDLRQLRDEAERDPQREHRLLKEFKGIGDTGADIFLREVQGTWQELAPFADQRSLESADRLGLPTDPEALARLVPVTELPTLMAALIRARLANDYDEILAAAGQPKSDS